ncbi:MAG: penicillin-insensitive murein endopeptidase [Polyangiaceae bacterium]
MRRLGILALTAAVTALVGCIGAPSPLAPGVHGSIGLPHRGCLTGGAPLPDKGEGFERFRKHDVRWGNPRLVAAIRTAAAAVHKARPGGAPLLVGDMSFQSGGFAEGHRSHRNGRDADLILYALTPDGRSVRTPGFINYGPDGLAVHEGKFYRLDVEREWLLVKALVTAPGADVQWLFLASWLEALVIEHARARGESDEIVHRAESVLLQPADSTPHADHLHLRLACTPDELVAGCAGGGPRWRWLSPMPQLPPMSDQEIFASIIGDLLPPGALAKLANPPATGTNATATNAANATGTNTTGTNATNATGTNATGTNATGTNGTGANATGTNATAANGAGAAAAPKPPAADEGATE